MWFGIAFDITAIAVAPISGVHVNPGAALARAIFGGIFHYGVIVKLFPDNRDEKAEQEVW